MPRPSANVFLSNGNLGIQAPGNFGTPVLVLGIPVAPTAGFSVAFSVKSLRDVDTAFADAGNAAVAAAIKTFFYGEAPEGTELFIVCVVNTTSLTAMAVEAIAGKAIDLTNGKARLVAFVRFHDNSYVITVANGFDGDVHACVTAAQTLANTYFTRRKPFRALIQGYGFTTFAAALDYSTNTKRNVGIVVGDVSDNPHAAILLCLARASRVQPQVNIGRVKSGSLAIDDAATVKLAGVLLENVQSTDLDTLYDKRYITFDRNEASPGYIFNDDNMLTDVTDDYNNLRNGRVIDNVVRIAYATYYLQLKDDVNVDEGGRLATVVERALEADIETAIDAQMRDQLSPKKDGTAAVYCQVNPSPADYPGLNAQNQITNPNFNLLAAGTVYLFVSARPKGSLKYINIYVGLTQ